MKRMILFCSIIFATIFSSAQIIHDDHSLQETYINKLTLEGRTTKSYDEIQGSPYLSEDFVPANVLASDKTEQAKVMMRYNIYADEMEFQDRGGKILALNKTNDENIIVLHEKKFKYFPQANLKSYCEILSEGEITLLKKYSVVYQKPEAPKAYQQSAPARFISGKERYYLLKDNNDVQYLSKTKDIIENLDGFQSEAKSFASENKLKLKSEEDLKKLVDFYNEKNK